MGSIPRLNPWVYCVSPIITKNINCVRCNRKLAPASNRRGDANLKTNRAVPRLWVEGRGPWALN